MKKELVIFGNGVQARLASYYFENDSDYNVVAFCVDSEYKKDGAFLEKPLITTDELLGRFPPSKYQVFVAMGYKKMNTLRQAKYDEMKKIGYTLATYISSRCSYISQNKPGDNCFILEDNTIQPYVKIGNNVTLWSGNHIGHDSVINDHCNITSHVVISGFTEIGQNCFIGVNATLHDDLKIAPFTLIAAGAIISKNTVEKGVYLPAQSTLFKKNSEEIGF